MADDIITVSLVMVRLVLFVNRLAAASVADHPVSLHFEIPLFDGLRGFLGESPSASAMG